MIAVLWQLGRKAPAAEKLPPRRGMRAQFTSRAALMKLVWHRMASRAR